MKTPCGLTIDDIAPKAREFIKLAAGIDVDWMFSWSAPRGRVTFRFDPRQPGGDFDSLACALTRYLQVGYETVSSNWLGTECVWDFGGRRVTLYHMHGEQTDAGIELSWTPQQ
jgi:hypothetical protein